MEWDEQIVYVITSSISGSKPTYAHISIGKDRMFHISWNFNMQDATRVTRVDEAKALLGFAEVFSGGKYAIKPLYLKRVVTYELEDCEIK